MSHNEIDNMALIMPSQANRMTTSKVKEDDEDKAEKRPGGKRREKKSRLEAHNR